MKTAVFSFIAFYVSAILCAQGSRIQNGLIAKKDSSLEEATGNDLFKKEIDEEVVNTVKRAFDTLNELFEKRHHHKKSPKSGNDGTKQQRRTLIEDIWTNIKTGATELWKYHKEDIFKAYGKRSDNEAGKVQRSNLEQQVEFQKRTFRKTSAFLTLIRRGWLSDAWETIKDTAGNIGETIKDGVGNIGETIKDGFSKLKDKIDDKIDETKEKWQKFKEVVGREASHATNRFSHIVNIIDKRALAAHNGYQDHERRSLAEDELEMRDERTDASLEVRRAVEALRDLQDFLDLASEFADHK